MILRFTTILFLFIGLSPFNSIFSQEILSCQEAAQRVGENITVTGIVKKIIYTRSSKTDDPLVYINLDRDYPNNRITIIIMSQNIEKFALQEQNYTGQKVLIKGFIHQQGNYKPTIFLEEKEQLQLDN